MDKIESQIRDADEASRILNSPLFERAFEDVRQMLITALEVIPTTESGDDQAKDVRRKLAALADVRYTLTKRIDTGKLAHHELSMRDKASRVGQKITRSISNAIGVR